MSYSSDNNFNNSFNNSSNDKSDKDPSTFEYFIKSLIANSRPGEDPVQTFNSFLRDFTNNGEAKANLAVLTIIEYLASEVSDLYNLAYTLTCQNNVLAYYLYRSAGSPLGDNPSGFSAWLSLQSAEFKAFHEKIM